MKYLAWTDGRYFYGHKLLTMSQIWGIIKDLKSDPKQYEIFVSIQNYTREGMTISCPLYADFDSTDLIQAHQDCTTYCENIESDLGVFPSMYFSGHKGYHAILDYPNIIHKYPHLIARSVVMEYARGLDTLDTSVYTGRRLFRINGSYHFNGKNFKYPVGPNDPEKYKERKYSNVQDIEAWEELIGKAMNEFIEPKPKEIIRGYGSLNDNITPCINHLLTKEIGKGHRHQSLFLLARFFRINNVDMQDAINIIQDNPTFNISRIQTVLESVYRSSYTSFVGCKGDGEDAIYLKQFCDILCPFHEDFGNIKCF